MLSANNIDRKSWIKYDSNSDFPIQNIPFGVFKTHNNEFHIATIIGKTIISTHIVGVIKNKEELFLYSLSISFFIRDLLNFI